MPNPSSTRHSRRIEKTIVSSQDWDRRHLPCVRLHESEKLLVGLLVVLLLFLPWALGSTHLLAQAGACFLALASLGAALLPRHGDTRSITAGGQLKRLFAFPVFWLGILLLVYISIQGFNTAWKIEGTEGYRWREASEHVSWLPAGVAGPDWNPFRWLLILGAPFLAVCAAWAGLTRRKSIHTLLTAAAINGFFIAAIGFFQIARNKTEILWFYEPPAQVFLATFPYHWQGAAYLTVVLAAAAGLAAHHFARARKTFRRSNPSGLFVFIGLVLMLMAIFSFSRTAAALCGGLMVAFLAHIGYREISAGASLGRKIFLTSLASIAAAVGMAVAASVAGDYVERGKSVSATAVADQGNWNATAEIGAAMFRQRPIFGWGAGAFPHLYREIAKQENIERAPASLAAEYAVSDWIRFPAELGIAGCLLLLLIFGYMLKQYLHVRTLQNPLAGFILLGVFAGLLLGLASPIFQNVAFLTTWSLLLAFGGILIRVEAAARGRGESGLD